MSRWCDAVNKLKFSVQATVGSDVRILISLVSRSILVELSNLVCHVGYCMFSSGNSFYLKVGML